MQGVAPLSPTVHVFEPSSQKSLAPFNDSPNIFGFKRDSDHESANEDLIPYWVDEDYAYDPANPRKPNMRELVEAMSGRKIEDLYADPNSNWQAFSRQASDILYGVVGGTRDTRDWESIMSSPDVVATVRLQTAILHEPRIEIGSEYERVKLTDGTVSEVLTAQFPVLKNKYNDILTSNFGSGSYNTTEELERFGGKYIHFDKSIFEEIEMANFDYENLEVIQEYIQGRLS